MVDESWKHPLVARVMCAFLGHQWRPSPDCEQYVTMPNDPGDTQPWGVFTRCARCNKPAPDWPFPWCPDEEGAVDA